MLAKFISDIESKILVNPYSPTKKKIIKAMSEYLKDTTNNRVLWGALTTNYNERMINISDIFKNIVALSDDDFIQFCTTYAVTKLPETSDFRAKLLAALTTSQHELTATRKMLIDLTKSFLAIAAGIFLLSAATNSKFGMYLSAFIAVVAIFNWVSNGAITNQLLEIYQTTGLNYDAINTRFSTTQNQAQMNLQQKPLLSTFFISTHRNAPACIDLEALTRADSAAPQPK